MRNWVIGAAMVALGSAAFIAVAGDRESGEGGNYPSTGVPGNGIYPDANCSGTAACVPTPVRNGNVDSTGLPPGFANPRPSGDVCGDGICGTSESSDSCAYDCPANPPSGGGSGGSSSGGSSGGSTPTPDPVDDPKACVRNLVIKTYNAKTNSLLVAPKTVTIDIRQTYEFWIRAVGTFTDNAYGCDGCGIQYRTYRNKTGGDVNAGGYSYSNVDGGHALVNDRTSHTEQIADEEHGGIRMKVTADTDDGKPYNNSCPTMKTCDATTIYSTKYTYGGNVNGTVMTVRYDLPSSHEGIKYSTSRSGVSPCSPDSNCTSTWSGQCTDGAWQGTETFRSSPKPSRCPGGATSCPQP